jgi:hypothetical protein
MDVRLTNLTGTEPPRSLSWALLDSPFAVILFRFLAGMGMFVFKVLVLMKLNTAFKAVSGGGSG